jgi:ankyrin repeat protein
MRLEQTVLHAAAQGGDTEMVTKLLDMGVAPDTPDYFQNIPLFEALDRQYFQVAEILLNHEASINSVNCAGNSPLMYFCYHGNVTMAMDLVKRGADVNVTDKRGCSPLWYAIAGQAKVKRRSKVKRNPTSFL